MAGSRGELIKAIQSEPGELGFIDQIHLKFIHPRYKKEIFEKFVQRCENS